MIKKIAIVTGTRAEFGLLRPLINEIKEDSFFDLQLIVTGMHLSPEFGYTINEIERSNFFVSKKVECLLSSDSSVGVSKSIALSLSGFADAFCELEPDLLIVLGDRTEILGAVVAASMANIPIAHLHGGETTEGAYDEAIRHAITKFSHLHFTSTEEYRRRVIQLGENPNTVFNVGAIGLDSIGGLNLFSRNDFEISIDFKLNKKNILVTYHPVTLDKESPAETFDNILRFLDSLINTNLIFTHANSDKNGRIINQMITDYVQKNKNKSIEFKSLGQLRYLSALQYVDVVIGNSSSGILEVPSFFIPSINIGDRQKGRIMSDSVIQTGTSQKEIANAFNLASDSSFREKLKKQKHIYGEGNTTSKIMSILRKKQEIVVKKSFYNIDFKI